MEFCHTDQWNLLVVESPEVENTEEKLRSNEGDEDAESNDGDEESSENVVDVVEFDLQDLSVRYWAFLLLNLASCKTTVCAFLLSFFFLILLDHFQNYFCLRVLETLTGLLLHCSGGWRFGIHPL